MVCSKFNSKSKYHQTKLRSIDEWETIFKIKDDFCEWLEMPNTFMQIMSEVGKSLAIAKQHVVAQIATLNSVSAFSKWLTLFDLAKFGIIHGFGFLLVVGILINLAQKGLTKGKRSKYSHTEANGHSRIQTLSTICDEIWEQGNNKIKDIEACQDVAKHFSQGK